jgi:hypothetical protein
LLFVIFVDLPVNTGLEGKVPSCEVLPVEDVDSTSMLVEPHLDELVVVGPITTPVLDDDVPRDLQFESRDLEKALYFGDVEVG